MGTTGAGKTTIGGMLAAQLNWQLADADTFHPPANIEKMSRGIPLNDTNRAPWLAAMRKAILEWIAAVKNVVLAWPANSPILRNLTMPSRLMQRNPRRRSSQESASSSGYLEMRGLPRQKLQGFAGACFGVVAGAAGALGVPKLTLGTCRAPSSVLK